MPTLRIMAYNVLYDGVGRDGLIREVVRAVNPDVAVLVEVSDAPACRRLADLVGGHCVVTAGRFSKWGVGLVSRWPIAESRLCGPWWSSRKWIEATIQPFGGPPLTIYGIQLVPHQVWPCEAWRRWEVHALLEHLRRRALRLHVLAGDFNAIAPGDGVCRAAAPTWVRAQWWLQGRLIAGWALKPLYDASYVDCFRARNGEADGFTVSSGNPSARIDYVFASPELRGSLRSCGALDTGARSAPARGGQRRSLSELFGWKVTRSLGGQPSDHLPVWADFEWSSAPGTTGGD